MNISLINILQGVVEDKSNSCLEYQLDVAKMMKEYTPFKEDEGVSIEHAKINADEIELNATQIKHIYVSLRISNASCIIATVPHTEGLDEIFEFESCI